MTATAPEISGLVRLIVLGPDSRADVVVPSRVPVADLLPDLARAVGVLDAYQVHGGYRLVRQSGVTAGAVLDPGRDLLAQGVGDGAVLTVEVGADDDLVPAYDDVVEAVADAVEAATRPWSQDASRRAALAAAAILLGTASVALGLERDEGWPVAAAAGVLAVLLLGERRCWAGSRTPPSPLPSSPGWPCRPRLSRGSRPHRTTTCSACRFSWPAWPGSAPRFSVWSRWTATAPR